MVRTASSLSHKDAQLAACADSVVRMLRSFQQASEQLSCSRNRSGLLYAQALEF